MIKIFQPLNQILFLQAFGANPSKYKKLGVNGHIGVDLNWGYGDPIKAGIEGKVVHVQDDAVVLICKINDLDYELSYSHGENYKVKPGDKVKEDTTLCYLGSSGLSTLVEDAKKSWAHVHVGLRKIDLYQKPNKCLWSWNNNKVQSYFVLNSDNGFDGFIDPTPYFEPIIWYIAKAIERKENMAKSYNNPGALRWSKFQSGTKNNFATFKTYEDGWKALIFQLTIAADGRSTVYNPNMGQEGGFTSGKYKRGFFEIYAPASDNNDPYKYAEDVEEWTGFGGDKEIKYWLLNPIEYARKFNNFESGAYAEGSKWYEIFNLRKLWSIITRDK